MPKLRSTSKDTLGRARKLPWPVLVQAGVVLRERWTDLSEKDRARLLGLLRESRGRLSNLSSKERGELKRLAGKADLKGLGRDLLSLRRGRRGRKLR